MNNAPCFNCPDRFPGCSSTCQKEEYLLDRARRYKIHDAKYYYYKRNKTTDRWRKKSFGKQEG